MRWMSSWIHMFPNWLHTLNQLNRGYASFRQTSLYSEKYGQRHNIWSQLNLSFVFFQYNPYRGNLSVSPSWGSLSGFWTRTHVVNLCLWSGWRTASGQMLRQCSGWLRRIRRRIMPNRLFVLPSFHPAAVQWGLSQLEVKQWTAGKAALNHNSSPEHRTNPVRPCKSLNSFSPRRKRGTENWKQRSPWIRLVKFWPESFQIANLFNTTKWERRSHCSVVSVNVQTFLYREGFLQWKYRLLIVKEMWTEWERWRKQNVFYSLWLR